MRRPRHAILTTLMATALGLGSSPPSSAQVPAGTPDQDPYLDTLAMEWVGLLQRERFDSAAAEVAPSVSTQLNAESLGSAWRQITGRFGVLELLEPGSRVRQQGYDVVNLAGTFGGQAFTVRVVYDEARKVMGFFVLPPGGATGGAVGAG